METPWTTTTLAREAEESEDLQRAAQDYEAVSKRDYEDEDDTSKKTAESSVVAEAFAPWRRLVVSFVPFRFFNDLFQILKQNRKEAVKI